MSAASAGQTGADGGRAAETVCRVSGSAQLAGPEGHARPAAERHHLHPHTQAQHCSQERGATHTHTHSLTHTHTHTHTHCDGAKYAPSLYIAHTHTSVTVNLYVCSELYRVRADESRV